MLSQLSNATVRQIVITDPKAHQDDPASIFASGFDRSKFTMKQIFVANKGETLPTLRAKFRKAITPTRKGRDKMPAEWKDLGDHVTITLSINGKDRSFSLGVDREMVPYQEITSRVQPDGEGFPSRASVHLVAEEMAAEVREEIEQ